MKTILENDKDFICDIKAPCFQMLTPEETDMVKASKTQVLFRKDDHITKQGAFASYVLFIVSGYARQHLEADGTKNFNLRIIKPGEFVGLSSVFTGNTFAYSSVAVTDCQAYLIENKAIADVAMQNGAFGFNIIRRYCELNNNLLSTVRNLMYKHMNGRMADILLYVDEFRKEKNDIFNLLSRKDIAEFAGISTESAVKLLKSFEKDSLIRLADKDIIILDRAKLEDISRMG